MGTFKSAPPWRGWLLIAITKAVPYLGSEDLRTRISEIERVSTDQDLSYDNLPLNVGDHPVHPFLRLTLPHAQLRRQ